MIRDGGISFTPRERSCRKTQPPAHTRVAKTIRAIGKAVTAGF